MVVGITKGNLIWYYSMFYTIIVCDNVPELPSLVQSSFSIARSRQHTLLNPAFCISVSRVFDRLGGKRVL